LKGEGRFKEKEAAGPKDRGGRERESIHSESGKSNGSHKGRGKGGESITEKGHRAWPVLE